MGVLTKKEKRLMEEQAEMEEGLSEKYGEQSEKRFDEDFEELRQRRGGYEGEMYPDDLFKYKKFRIDPEAKKEFPLLISKDIPLAHYKGSLPDIEFLTLEVETAVLCENILVEEKKFYEVNDEGKRILDQNTGMPKIIVKRVYDKHFDPIMNFFKASVLFMSNASRAIGEDREAVLDKTTTLQKGLIKKNEKSDRIFGMGGK